MVTVYIFEYKCLNYTFVFKLGSCGKLTKGDDSEAPEAFFSINDFYN